MRPALLLRLAPDLGPACVRLLCNWSRPSTLVAWLRDVRERAAAAIVAVRAAERIARLSLRVRLLLLCAPSPEHVPVRYYIGVR